jgi:hypothetical protein
MDERRWTNPSQPQTLQFAVFLLYLRAFLVAIAGLWPLGLLFAAAYAGGGFGIANEKKWGYRLAVGITVLVVGVTLLRFGLSAIFGLYVINTMFQVALVALLLHPQSREYQRIWFK